MLRIKLTKSPIGFNWRIRRTVAALGLRKVHQVVEQPDNSSIRGMVHHVHHMVTVEVVEGEVTKQKAGSGKPKAVKAAKPEPTATAMWALVHGLAFLHLDGKLDASSAKIVDERVRAAVSAVLHLS